MHPLIADGGEMTILRDLAAFSYGRWTVDWPESVPDEQRPELPDDRDFGYASKLKKDPGRFGRRFVRADVQIKAQDFDEAGKPIPFSGESDVEETLDDAAKRTDGDVFFEREITRAGLGALVPRVDFDVDSVVPVLIWGKTIPAPVTSIEDVVEQGAVVDYRVHVGGQLLQDDAARERANREVERTIAQERRERVKAVSKERKARKSAISGERAARTEAISAEAQARALADSEEARARQKAISDLSESFSTELETYGRLVEEAKNSVDPATQQVVNFWSEENQNNFNKAVQLTLSAQSAYNDINNIKWVSQDAWNEQQNKIDAAQDEAARATHELALANQKAAAANQAATEANAYAIRVEREANRRRPRLVFARFAEYKNIYRDPENFVRLEPYGSGDRGIKVTALGDWTGEMVVRATAIGPLSANSLDSTKVQVTSYSRVFNGIPESAQMAYNVIDITVFPD